MQFSTEQTHAVYGGARAVTWSLIERPVGRVDVPTWCRGVHLEWVDGYSNPPGFRLKVHGEVRDWAGKAFSRNGNLYQARHPDGRLEQYSHSGEVSLAPIRMFQSADGAIRRERRYGPQWGDQPGFGSVMDGVRSGHEPGEFVDVERLATTPQQGFGGSQIWVTMDDGREICLRGPWHVGAPAGYTETAYVDVSDDWFRRVKGKRQWWQVTARAGLYITNDLAIRILSTFAPHIELALVDYGYAKGIEPLKPEWDAPKCVTLDRQRAA